MPSQTKTPGTMGVDAYTIPYAWQNINNAKVEDGSYASAVGTANFTSDILVATNFGFSIPSDATISGIEVKLKRYANEGGTDVETSIFGSFIGTRYPITGVTWPLSLAFDTLGGSAHLWGWSDIDYNDINSSNYGFCVKASCAGKRTRTLYVDYIEMTVHYTLPANGNFFLMF